MKKKYSTPSMRIVKIAISHLLTGTNQNPTQGEGQGFEWGDDV
jgi:hypothetical protein